MVFSARKGDDWYIAFAANDDSLVRAERDDHLYQGDAFELFFVGKNLNYSGDYSGLVASGPAGQAAFFQLVVCPPPGADTASHFPLYRTDVALRDRFISEARITSWRRGSLWGAEVSIPLGGLESSVRNTLLGRSPLRMNLDYLDYHGTLAPGGAPFFFYRPDQVYCPDPLEKYVNWPKWMKPLRFE